MKIVREIGRGGFGIVHEIEDDSGSRLAQKTYYFNQSFACTPEIDEHLKRRFEREAKLQSGINHRNVVPILQKSLQNDPPCFTMPLAEGTLEDGIRQSKTLNGHYMLALLDVMAAMEDLHSVKIFHRDLKPGNVLRFLDQNDQRGYFYAVSDFGLVSLQQTQVSILTQVGMKMTSDFYTAPEITQDLSKASPQSDIYSIGCILHDFVGKEARVPCGEIDEDGPYGAIMRSCTRRDPSRRFRSIAGLRDALLSISISSEESNENLIEQSSAEIIEALSSSDSLPEEQWQLILDQLETKNICQNTKGAILKKLSIQRIDEVFDISKRIGERLGEIYSEWIRNGAFIFSECDGLANRLRHFFNNGDVSLQSEALMALLIMGTSHNRWYVERMFVDLQTQMSEILAKRVAIEFRADDIVARQAINHLRWSISFDINQLHPALLQVVGPENR